MKKTNFKAEDFKKFIGSNLKELRVKNNLLISEVALMTGCSESSIKSAEKGRAKDIDIYVLFACAVSYPMQTLLDFNIVLEPKYRIEVSSSKTSIIKKFILNNIDFFAESRVVSEIVNYFNESNGELKTMSSEVSGVMRTLTENGFFYVVDVRSGKKMYKRIE